jgi:hypothetical protein
MSFPPPLSLHHYFVVAARMRHHFESNLVAVEEPRVAALEDPDLAAFELFSGPRGNFMYYWYASLYVVVQGFRNLRLIDPRINALLASPNVKALRRCWNGCSSEMFRFFSERSAHIAWAAVPSNQKGASGSAQVVLGSVANHPGRAGSRS